MLLLSKIRYEVEERRRGKGERERGGRAWGQDRRGTWGSRRSSRRKRRRMEN